MLSFCVSGLGLILFLAVLVLTRYSCIIGCSKIYEKSASLAHHKTAALLLYNFTKKVRRYTFRRETMHSQSIWTFLSEPNNLWYVIDCQSTELLITDSYYCLGIILIWRIKRQWKSGEIPSRPAESLSMDITTSPAASNLIPVPEPELILNPIPPPPVLTTSGHPHGLQKLLQKFKVFSHSYQCLHHHHLCQMQRLGKHQHSMFC